MTNAVANLTAEELADLRWAYRHLEHPSLAARLCSAVGTPIEQGLRLLPRSWSKHLHAAVEFSIRKTLDSAVASMGRIPPAESHDRVHKLMVMGTGALGGLFGPLTLLAELPITTALMLRSIANVAHSEGEDLNTPEGRLACMEVYALGGRTGEDKSADAGYYGLRITLGFHFATSLLYSGNAASVKNMPGGIQLVRAIASRFGAVISDHAAARLVPVAGAVSGSLLNLVFMDHFQKVAKGHFIVRRLERKYGSAVIKTEYEQLGQEEAEAAKAYSPLEGW
jgi:hypothetical protein